MGTKESERVRGILRITDDLLTLPVARHNVLAIQDWLNGYIEGQSLASWLKLDLSLTTESRETIRR